MKVSVVSIGAWLTYGSDRVAFKTAEKCIRAALELGVNFIDVADIYARGEAEKTVGKIIKDYDRHKLVVSTKAYWPMSDDVNDRGLSRKHLFESVEQSLQRLKTDYVDIFFCHRYDPETPTEETVRAIEDLIRQGKIRYWGTSMWDAEHIDAAVAAADKYNAYRPVVEQPLYNMLDREQVEGGLERALSQYGVGLVVWSPLAQGVLTGKYNDGIPKGSRIDQIDADWIKEQIAEHRLEKVRELTKLADEMGVSMSNLALAWAMKHPYVDSVITGATRPKHVKENVKAVEITIPRDVEERIEEILQNKPWQSQRPLDTPHEDPVL